MEDNNNKKDKAFIFYFHCKACGVSLNHKSHNVKNGIHESPYCSKCSSYAFDTSDSDREYEHQAISDQFLNTIPGFDSYSD